MLTKEKALYQVKLILDYLPEEEYKMISQDTIDYIENNFEYDENIIINPNIPLENQEIDDKAYELLDKIIKSAENNKKVNETENIFENLASTKGFDNNEVQIENIRLKNILETLKEENSKIPKAKELLEEYKKALNQKDNEIAKLKENNQYLNQYIQKIPKFLRRIFIKDSDLKLLNRENK